MKCKVLSQERLKLIACATMLIDHIGAALLPSLWLRIIGRISFPIYCFLLVEGAVHTRNAWKYALRLLICAVISELPHDILFGDGLNLRGLNIMATLLLGFCMLRLMEKAPFWWLRVIIIGVFAAAARLLGVSYGWRGILVIAVFALTRGRKRSWLWQLLGIGILFLSMNSTRWDVGLFKVPIQVFGVLALIPIALYSGRKDTNSKAVQWGFYLFYPLHLLALYFITLI